MAVFRVLLNVLVIAVLLLASHLPEAYIFGFAVVMLGICLACVVMLQLSQRDREGGGGVGAA